MSCFLCHSGHSGWVLCCAVFGVVWGLVGLLVLFLVCLPWLWGGLSFEGFALFLFCLESLILAQDERWRRA